MRVLSGYAIENLLVRQHKHALTELSAPYKWFLDWEGERVGSRNSDVLKEHLVDCFFLLFFGLVAKAVPQVDSFDLFNTLLWVSVGNSLSGFEIAIGQDLLDIV